jgi:hypothetical protein
MGTAFTAADADAIRRAYLEDLPRLDDFDTRSTRGRRASGRWCGRKA